MNVTCYNSSDERTAVIRSFADRESQTLFEEGRSRRFPPDVQRRMLRKLTLLDKAIGAADLRVPPSNRLHSLQGDRKSQWSISVNDQWRICFRFEGKHAYDVEICDYH